MCHAIGEFVPCLSRPRGPLASIAAKDVAIDSKAVLSIAIGREAGLVAGR